MAGTVNYLYDADQDVFTIVDCADQNNNNSVSVPAVRPGRVIRVRVEVLLTGMTLVYDVQIDGQSGTTELEESSVFPTLADAVAAYQIELT